MCGASAIMRNFLVEVFVVVKVNLLLFKGKFAGMRATLRSKFIDLLGNLSALADTFGTCQKRCVLCRNTSMWSMSKLVVLRDPIERSFLPTNKLPSINSSRFFLKIGGVEFRYLTTQSGTKMRCLYFILPCNSLKQAHMTKYEVTFQASKLKSR